jgi:hypothetical protein
MSRIINLSRVALLLAACASGAHATPQCKVLDPELQATYSGGCVNGLAEGEGVATGAAEYRGEFKAGRKHGKGVKTWPGGDSYEGEFVEDRKEGKGRYVWGPGPWLGESYEGTYVNDKRHGIGTYRWPTGDVYTGPWQDDLIAGQLTPMMQARAKFEAEARAAVVKEGQKVCRVRQPGAAEYELVSGIVVGVKEEQVGIRITEPGAIAGAMLERGAMLWESPTDWVPCY